MTGLLLVGAVRIGGSRDKYPEIQIWRNTDGNTYTMKDGSQEIRLAEGDFSPDGVLQYSLATPISFKSGDVLGVYQPERRESVVRVYYDTNASTTYRVSKKQRSVNISEVQTISNQLVLISPISGKS